MVAKNGAKVAKTVHLPYSKWSKTCKKWFGK